MIPRLKPWLGGAELAAVPRPAPRDAVPRFEDAFAAVFGMRHAVAFPYGRSGLWALLRSMGIQDAEVLLPAYACSVVGGVRPRPARRWGTSATAPRRSRRTW